MRSTIRRAVIICAILGAGCSLNAYGVSRVDDARPEWIAYGRCLGDWRLTADPAGAPANARVEVYVARTYVECAMSPGPQRAPVCAWRINNGTASVAEDGTITYAGERRGASMMSRASAGSVSFRLLDERTLSATIDGRTACYRLMRDGEPLP